MNIITEEARVLTVVGPMEEREEIIKTFERLKGEGYILQRSSGPPGVSIGTVDTSKYEVSGIIVDKLRYVS